MADDELNEANGAGQRPVTLGQLVTLLDGRAVTRSNIPKVQIFHFKGEKVSEWLELLEQITDEMTEEEKFCRISKYVWWVMRPKVMRVAAEAASNWGNFKAEMERRYQLGDGLLTTEDLERLERSDFMTVGAFATAFEKMARKVPGLAEESQCAILLSNFTECESVSLTRRGAIGRKLTWETVKQSLADGELDQVYQFQMKQQWQKRKTRVVIEGADINLQLLIADGIAKYQADQQKAIGKQVLTVTQSQARALKKGKVVEQVEDDDEDEEEPTKLMKSQRKARNQAAGGQGSGKNAGVQATAPAQVNTNLASTSGAPPQGPVPLGPWPKAIPPVWPSQEPPSESQPREKQPVIDTGDEGKEDEEDERLRKEEEEQAAQRAKKRKPEDKPERAARGEGSRKQNYAVPLEDGLNIEAMVDRLLEGHNDLLNLKDILAFAPKLREGFKMRLSRRRVASVRLGDLIPVEAH
ncbi:hypothetical protein CBR_g49045 [Chara braunii]|uniref:Retrotransposon gag domain-containing protein n=1 Tax=Chara braunii TaxID=69332 RepID=A0A388M4B6_CHABU|nr:hypothetical protein CBR_g49045 [Chara braunii]|eukprot:GBG89335.1 hypothetical protein CBR_g49045 [Chara braunii]